MLTKDHVRSEVLLVLKMELYIKVSGSLKRIKKTEEVFKFGQMVQDMMDFGEMEWQMDMVA